VTGGRPRGVAELADRLAAGSVRSVDVVEELLERTARLDPALRAYRVLLAEQARDAARAADRARAAGDSRPLLGVPVAVKDNVALAGVATRHGTASAEPPAPADGATLRALRGAGLVVMGVTAMPELALWAVTARRGNPPTRNPWRLDRTPGGSSGGSAAAVAAGLVPVAHATDGLGSVRIPAAWSGLVGLKPSHGLLPLDEPDHWHGLSDTGVLTRTVRDTALLLDALAGSPRGGPADAPAAPARVGWSLRGSTPGLRVHPEIRSALRRTAARLAARGHEVRRADPPLAETTHLVLPRYLAGAAEDHRRLADPHATEHRTRAMAAAGRRLPAAAVARARRDSGRLARRLAERLFDRVDVLLQPTTAVPALDAEAFVDRGALTSLLGFARAVPYTQLANLTGFPAVSLPVALTGDGLPIGLQLTGPPGSDRRLLRIAEQLQRDTGWPDRWPPLVGLDPRDDRRHAGNGPGAGEGRQAAPHPDG
jgi:amidase